MKTKKPIPYEFVLEQLEAAGPYTRPMFGCTSVYVGGRIVLILRQKETWTQDNGVWLATTKEHHESLKKEFLHMRSITVLGKGVTGWQILPEGAPDFEESIVRACRLVLAGDPRIGKTPKPRRRPKARSEQMPATAARRKTKTAKRP